MTETNQQDFTLLDPEAELSTDEIKRHFKRLNNELAIAGQKLKAARFAELQAERAWKDKRTELLLDDRCPDIDRSENVSRQDREDWLTGQAPDLWWDYRGKKTVREVALDYTRTLKEQVKCVQSLNATARQMDELTWRHA